MRAIGLRALAAPLAVPLRRGLDLVLPPLALEDERAPGAPPQTPGLGVRHWERIAFIGGPVCAACGAPFAYDLGPGALCAACQARRPAWGRARAACLYDDASRDLILKLKHADRPDLGRLFARWLSRAAAALLEEADAVTPVPMHRGRLFARRYNQAAEVARPLARLARVPYRPGLLARARDTGTQGGRSGRSRRINVKGAFAVPQTQRRRLQGLRVVLVDDVLTTGATAEACARALLAAGAARVDVAVVARVQERAGLAI